MSHVANAKVHAATMEVKHLKQFRGISYHNDPESAECLVMPPSTHTRTYIALRTEVRDTHREYT